VDIESRFNDLEKQLKQMKDLNNQLKEQDKKLKVVDEKQEEKVREVKEQLDDQELKLQEVEDVLSKRLSVLEQQPGTLLWSIDNYTEHQLGASSGLKKHFYSDPFYTGKYGYKLRCFVKFNDKGSQLSVYVELLRGEFDSLLPWPLSKKIVITLINQRKHGNLVMTLSSQEETSFRRLCTTNQEFYGFLRFAKHETIKSQGFLKDDRIFIKVEVEPFDVLANN